MKKLKRWLKKNRYYVIGFVLISAIGIMATIGAAVSNNSEEVVVIPTEPPIEIPTLTSTPTDTHNPTYTPIPTCEACANMTPIPTLPPWVTPSVTPTGTIPTATPITGTPAINDCDINADGVINRNDIMLMIWAMGGTWSPIGVGFSNADINDDGKIDYLDCNYCIKIVEHWID